MNVIKDIETRIEKYRKSNKNPCKSYATEGAAEKATAKIAELVGKEHETHSARYVVFYIEAWGRWVGAVDLNEVISRPDSNGGYLGLAASKGFYTY